MILAPLIYPSAPIWLLQTLFWCSILLFIVLIVAAFYIARGTTEEQIRRCKQAIISIFIVLCIICLTVSMRWYISGKIDKKTPQIPLSIPLHQQVQSKTTDGQPSANKKHKKQIKKENPKTEQQIGGAIFMNPGSGLIMHHVDIINNGIGVSAPPDANILMDDVNFKNNGKAVDIRDK